MRLCYSWESCIVLDSRFQFLVRFQWDTGTVLREQFYSRGVSYFKSEFFVLLPYLSSTHEKANCIAVFWTERPHSLGSCHLRCV